MRCAALVFAVFVLVGCHLRKEAAVDAGTEAEEDGAAEGAAASPSESTTPAVVGSAEPAPKHVAARCAAGEVAILLPPSDETCVVECKSSAACPPGWACDGEGVLSHGGRPGGTITFCRSGGHGKATDAGPAPSTATHDGGNATPPQHVDAGSPMKKLDVKQVGGHCPAGYGPCGVACRLTCGKDVDCGAPNAHCQAGFCVGPGAQPCGK
jgi:hypothetical protein